MIQTKYSNTILIFLKEKKNTSDFSQTLLFTILIYSKGIVIRSRKLLKQEGKPNLGKGSLHFKVS